MLEIKAILLTQGMHGMVSQVEGLARALGLSYKHQTVKLKPLWNLIPPKFSPISENLIRNSGIKNVSVLKGPCLAKELARKNQTSVVIANKSINFAKKIGISRPKVAVLSATEEVIESVPSSIDADIITKRVIEEKIDADVFGPLAFDNSVSKKSAAIKKIKNSVSGDVDILLVPNIETGNALVKMMIYFMGACAAGVVLGGKAPVVITSRSDEAEARLASIAASIVALG